MRGKDIAFTSAAIFYATIATGAWSYTIPTFVRIDKSNLSSTINKSQNTGYITQNFLMSAIRVTSDERVYAAWQSWRGAGFTYYDIA